MFGACLSRNNTAQEQPWPRGTWRALNTTMLPKQITNWITSRKFDKTLSLQHIYWTCTLDMRLHRLCVDTADACKSFPVLVVQRSKKWLKKMFPGSRMSQKLVFWQKLTYVGLGARAPRRRQELASEMQGLCLALEGLDRQEWRKLVDALCTTWPPEDWWQWYLQATMQFCFTLQTNSLLIIFTDGLLNHEKVGTDVFQSQ